jgi:hypothetical protein
MNTLNIVSVLFSHCIKVKTDWQIWYDHYYYFIAIYVETCVVAAGIEKKPDSTRARNWFAVWFLRGGLRLPLSYRLINAPQSH